MKNIKLGWREYTRRINRMTTEEREKRKERETKLEVRETGTKPDQTLEKKVLKLRFWSVRIKLEFQNQKL